VHAEHGHPHPGGDGAPLYRLFGPSLSKPHSMLVNRQGRRFANESSYYCVTQGLLEFRGSQSLGSSSDVPAGKLLFDLSPALGGQDHCAQLVALGADELLHTAVFEALQEGREITDHPAGGGELVVGDAD
jgi:hypothetical protein